MESRKIQKVGAATLTISLPKDWTEHRNLKKGDQVFIVEEGDSLRILPGPAMEERKRKWETYVIDADLCDEPGLLERIIVGNYVLGRQKIIVRSATRLCTEHLAETRTASTRLLGLGIIEETPTMVTVQCAIDPADYPLATLVRRLLDLGATMLDESLEALLTGDRRLAEDAIKREDDADTMYWLILRLVLSAQVDDALTSPLGMSSRLENAGYRVVARDLESIADFATTIAKAVVALLDANAELGPAMARQLRDLVWLVRDTCRKALEGVLSRNIKEANEAIRAQEAVAKKAEGLVGLLLKDHDRPAVVLPLRAIIDGLLEISWYGHSIAVIAFNRYLEKPTNLSQPVKAI